MKFARFISDGVNTYEIGDGTGESVEVTDETIMASMSRLGIMTDNNKGVYFVDSNGYILFQATAEGVNYINKDKEKSKYGGLKIVSLGDSLSAHDKWQKWLVKWLGVTFDADENINGKDGHAAIAQGGTSVLPNAANSIYMRALDLHYYNPDIIFYLGVNDINHYGGTDTVNESLIGTINDTPYKLDKIFTEATDEEKATYTNALNDGRPTVYAYFMGMIEKLMETNPTAQLFIMTPMQMWTETGNHGMGRERLITIWTEIVDKYKLPFIDIWNTSGVNKFNASSYYPNVGNVHPTDAGYKRMAYTIARNM